MLNNGFGFGEIFWLETFIIDSFGLDFLKLNFITDISTSNLALDLDLSFNSSCSFWIFISSKILSFENCASFFFKLNTSILNLSRFCTEGDFCFVTDIPILVKTADKEVNIEHMYSILTTVQ